MASRFQIRSGSSTPSPSDLLDKELGYNVNDKKLYINDNGSIHKITTDIVDNLITNDSDKALSAKQGKLLNDVLRDGWIDAHETWTYYAATTITVPSGAMNRYQRGDKIRFKQGGDWKYFFVVSAANTAIAVKGAISGTEVENAPITDNYYSKAASPQGFPFVICRDVLYTGDTPLAPGDYIYNAGSYHPMGYNFLLLRLTSNVNSAHRTTVIIAASGWQYVFVNEYHVQKTLNCRVYGDRLTVSTYTGEWILSEIAGFLFN